jgi:hypothetical protein
MKIILSLIIGGALIVSGFGQTRSVLVGTNNAVVQPTNFWSADASNARTGLGLGSAATNPATAFQPSSTALSNLATGNGGSLSNLTATSIVGIIPSSNIATVSFTNISGTLAIASGGTGATNAVNARQNLGSTTVGDALFIATNAAAARTAIGALASNDNGSGLTNLTAGNITGTVALASNVSGVVAITNGGSGATTAGGSRTNLELGVTNAVQFGSLSIGAAGASLTEFSGAAGIGWQGTSNRITFSSSGVTLTTNNMAFNFGAGNTNGAAITRTNLGLGWSALTNTNSTNFRNAIGLGVTNDVVFAGLFVTNIGTYLAARFDANSGGFPLEIYTTDEDLAAGYGSSAYAIGVGAYGVAIKYGASDTDWGFPVLTDGNGQVIRPNNFWQVAPISTTVQYQTNVVSTSTNAATNSRNLFLYSLTTSVSGITNTITLPTNPATTFEGDRATITHLAQTTNTVTAVRQLGSATNIITLNQYEEAVLFIYRSGAWSLADNISYVEPIYFSGTNASNNIAQSRTNLGLGWSALTNSNAATTLLGYTTNGQVVYTGTNVLTFTNTNGIEGVKFNKIGIENGIFLYDQATVSFDGEAYFNTISFQTTNDASGTRANLGFSTNLNTLWTATNASNARSAVGLGATWLTNTNVTNFRSAIGLGATNDVTFNSVRFSDNGYIIKTNGLGLVFEDPVNNDDVLTLPYDANPVILNENYWNDATVRSNLGLPLAALTNTSNVTFQSAVFTTNAAPTNTANVNGVGFNTAVRWMEITLAIDGTNQVFRIPLFQ